MSECANTEEKSLRRKTVEFLVSNHCHVVICITPLLLLNYVHQMRTENHLGAAKKGIFLFKYSVEA
jgi:hypothetical protein